MMSDRHGTYAAVNQHKRDGEPLCDDCNLAAALYITGWRRRTELGMPIKGRDERPAWAGRVDLADAAMVGPVLDAAWRANA